MSQHPYLKVAEVAAELQISPNGVYKLIQRGKLPAVRHSERGIRVTRWALEAYRHRLAGHAPDVQRPVDDLDVSALRERFEAETGSSPEQWIASWKRDDVEDSPDNAARVVRALGLREAAGVAQATAALAGPPSTRR